MARPRYPKQSGPPPPALPPETRTVGQVVGETIRLYGERFWASLAVGVGPAVVTAVSAQTSRSFALLFGSTAGAVLLAAAYVGAAHIGARRPLEPRAALPAAVCALVLFVPLPALALLYGLPALVWVLLVGLAVPAAVAERRGAGESLARGPALLRADPVHALFSLVTFIVLVLLAQSVLFFLLRGFGESAARVAAFLATLVISPLILLGGSLLYVDQAARVGSRRRPKGASRADVHPALDPDPPGPADAERAS
jgi:hypothetical protein